MRIRKAYQGTVPSNKILDTYSTSQTDTYSCAFINNIRDSGTGYIKYPDGTMICYGNASGSGTTSGYYQFGQVNNSITFAQEFISVPNILLTGSGYEFVSITCTSVTTTGCNARTIKTSGSSPNDYNVNYIAIGKWK